MKETIEITFFVMLFLTMIPCIIYLWIHFIDEIISKTNYYYNIQVKNNELMEELIERDAEIHHLKEHIENL
jgi:hypothetical protein